MPRASIVFVGRASAFPLRVGPISVPGWIVEQHETIPGELGTPQCTVDLESLLQRYSRDQRAVASEHSFVVLLVVQGASPSRPVRAKEIQLPGIQAWISSLDDSVDAAVMSETLRDQLSSIASGQQIIPVRRIVSDARVGAISWSGWSYDRNMDCYSTVAFDVRGVRGEVLTVADGVGSRALGDIASRLLATTAPAVVSSLARTLGRQSGVPRESAMRDAIGAGMKEMASTLSQVAIGEVRESEKIDGGSSAPIAPSDFASTLVMSLRVEDQCAIAWIGDSRAYLFRDGLLALLTQDHSVARIEYGERHPDRADSHPDGRVLVRACTPDVPLDPEIVLTSLEDGDLLLLCSDGLSEGAQSHDYLETLINLALVSGESVSSLPAYLANRVWTNTHDNISIVACGFGSVTSPLSDGACVDRGVAEWRGLSEEALERVNQWPDLATRRVDGSAAVDGRWNEFKGRPLGGWANDLGSCWRCRDCNGVGVGGWPVQCPSCGHELEPRPLAVVVRPDGTITVDEVSTTSDRVVVGRATSSGHSPGSGSSLALQAEPRAAWFHAGIEITTNGWRVTDSGSANGTWMQVTVEGQELPFGAPIRIGDTLLTIARPANNSGDR